MPGHPASPPQLIITSGRATGSAFAVPVGYSEIGRLPGSAIRLDQDGVSRRHAAVSRAGDQLVVNDLGSTNGTYVNGRRLGDAPPWPLRDGDQLRIGDVELRLSCPSADDAAAEGAPSYGFGDVQGPVNAGEGQQYVAGRDQYVAGRDIYGDDRRMIVNADYEPGDELFQGRGVGRLLLILGSVIALAGFAVWGYFIFTMASVDTGPSDNPFTDRKLFGVPMAPLGFGAFLLGGVLSGIGGAKSKAARKRDEEARYPYRRG
jgi:hypothetical protein